MRHPNSSKTSKQHAILFWEVSEKPSRDCKESQGERGLLREAGNFRQQEERKGKQQHTCINGTLITWFAKAVVMWVVG